MSTIRKYLLLPLIFIVAYLTTFWFDWQYKFLIIKYYKCFTDGKIHFNGKPFFFFPTGYFSLSFGLYCTALAFILLIKDTKKKLLKVVVTLITFFLSMAIISYINSNADLIECTACSNGERNLRYSEVPYDTIFIESLAISLLIFFLLDAVMKRNQLKK